MSTDSSFNTSDNTTTTTTATLSSINIASDFADTTKYGAEGASQTQNPTCPEAEGSRTGMIVGFTLPLIGLLVLVVLMGIYIYLQKKKSLPYSPTQRFYNLQAGTLQTPPKKSGEHKSLTLTLPEKGTTDAIYCKAAMLPAREAGDQTYCNTANDDGQPYCNTMDMGHSTKQDRTNSIKGQDEREKYRYEEVQVTPAPRKIISNDDYDVTMVDNTEYLQNVLK